MIHGENRSYCLVLLGNYIFWFTVDFSKFFLLFVLLFKLYWPNLSFVTLPLLPHHFSFSTSSDLFMNSLSFFSAACMDIILEASTKAWVASSGPYIYLRRTHVQSVISQQLPVVAQPVVTPSTEGSHAVIAVVTPCVRWPVLLSWWLF